MLDRRGRSEAIAQLAALSASREPSLRPESIKVVRRESPGRRRRPTRRTVLASDSHVPDVDPVAWALFRAALRDLEAGLWIVGDFLDLESCTRHPPMGEYVPDLKEEYEHGNARLDQIERVIQSDERDFFEGNHCQRYFRTYTSWPHAIRSMVPPPQAGLGLEKRGFRWVPLGLGESEVDGAKENQPVKRGNLFVHHGDFYPKNHAFKHLDEYGVSQVYGHTHRAQQVYMTKPDPATGRCDRVVHVTGLPCLRRLRAPWRAQPRMTGWTNGFGVIEWDDDEAHVFNVVVRNGAACYGGFRWVAR